MKTVRKLERIAPREGGTAEYLLLKETLEQITKGSLSDSLSEKLDMVLEAMDKANAQRDEELKQVKQLLLSVPKDKVDVEGIITKVVGLVGTAPVLDVDGLVEKLSSPVSPVYHFEIERSPSGLLTGIVATPTGVSKVNKDGIKSAF